MEKLSTPQLCWNITSSISSIVRHGIAFLIPFLSLIRPSYFFLVVFGGGAALLLKRRRVIRPQDTNLDLENDLITVELDKDTQQVNFSNLWEIN